MSVFGAYSHYYDLLYEDKNYSKEVEFVSAIIRRHAPDARTVLDLGCGTGFHACAFAREGYLVTGLDRSADMLAKARERRTQAGANGSVHVDFQQGDIRDFKLTARFDVVVALFHVISYLPANADLEATFARIREHLQPGGLLIFDHWYGPAVLTDRPAPRIKTFENDEVKIVRIATPALLVNDNLVDVRYDLTIIDKIIQPLLPSCGEPQDAIPVLARDSSPCWRGMSLHPVEFREWLSGKVPDQSTWNTFVAAVVRPEAL